MMRRDAPSDLAAASAQARDAVLQAQVAAPGEHSLADVATRVASAVAEAEPAGSREGRAERFARWIADGDFLPSVPTLANAGRGGQLAACFVLEVADSLESIYGGLQRAARIQQAFNLIHQLGNTPDGAASR